MSIITDKYVIFDVDGTIGYFDFPYAIYGLMFKKTNILNIENIDDIFTDFFAKVLQTNILRPSLLELFKQLSLLKKNNEVKSVGIYTTTSRNISFRNIGMKHKEQEQRSNLVNWVNAIRKGLNKFVNNSFNFEESFELFDHDISGDEEPPNFSETDKSSDKKHLSTIIDSYSSDIDETHKMKIRMIDDTLDILGIDVPDIDFIITNISTYKCFNETEIRKILTPEILKRYNEVLNFDFAFEFDHTLDLFNTRYYPIVENKCIDELRTIYLFLRDIES